MNGLPGKGYILSKLTSILHNNAYYLSNAGAYILPNTWIFIAQATDVNQRQQYGFRYVLGSSYTAAATANFKSRDPISSGNFYSLTEAATVQWTNNVYAEHCNCKMQYVRVYIDYVSYNEDMMINLAIMNPSSKN